ncbi:flagellar assembly protein FliH [Pontibacillus yanchengensis]|uniref:Flagellar assembly protein FliH n=1 Tax=Pontibacillus yanchengensis Y32 TaxID=1385514 RepID=A0A0A2TXP2_9BACI|nr:flagellar assembly protein FliH [Pontibacillus yanchengensis]KGP74040.1 hypothetical protein N782_18980 [Pontibacillus yanchengensis Y32]
MSNSKKVIGLKPINTQPPSQTITTNDEVEVTQEHADQVKQQAEETFLQAEETLKQAEERAQQLIAEAQTDIEQQKSNWEQEKQELIKQVKEDAYKDGFAEGKVEAESEYESLIQHAQSITARAEQDYKHRVEESEETILQLGIASASKILNKKLHEEPYQFVEIVRSLIEEVKEQGQLSIYVHPDQYEQVLSQKTELQMVVDNQADLSIYPKHNLTSYQCYAESPFGRVDASIDSQLQELRTKLLELLEEAKASENESTY